MDRLSEMADHGCVLSQKKGGQLELVMGSIENSSLKSTLEYGISLPMSSETTVYLTEGVERDILSYSICHDMIRSEFATRNNLTITVNDVQDHYVGRSIGRVRTFDALEFLSTVGICSRNYDKSYTFKESNINKIMDVAEKLEEKRVIEWLDEDTSRQSSIDQFSI